jgi:hypothetical protein
MTCNLQEGWGLIIQVHALHAFPILGNLAYSQLSSGCSSLDCPPRVLRERSHAAVSRCIVHVHQPWTMVSRHRDEPAYSMPFTRTYAHAWATITSGQQVHHSKTSRVWTSYLVGP